MIVVEVFSKVFLYFQNLSFTKLILGAALYVLRKTKPLIVQELINKLNLLTPTQRYQNMVTKITLLRGV